MDIFEIFMILFTLLEGNGICDFTKKLIIAGHYSKMGDSCGSNGHGAVIRVLFCGPYWPASTNDTREYLQNYPFIQVSFKFYNVALCKKSAAACVL
jgi:hypothetical protein